MHDCRCSDPYFILELLYGEEKGQQAAGQLRRRLESFSAPSAAEPLHEADAMLVTYADQFQRAGERPLQTFMDVAGHLLKDMVSGVHLLPFYPNASHDGYAVTDPRKVIPEWGTWRDIVRIGSEYRLMVDAAVNHVSSRSAWFQGYLQGEERYRDYFISVPPEADLSRVMRPRSSLLRQRFETREGPKWVWTTFGADQVDLNYQNPQVLLETVENLLFYVENCVKLIRLDAAAYLWKEIGTPCIHHPRAHLVVNFLHALLKEAAPNVLLVTGSNVSHEENVSYFGSGHNESHLVYNFALSPLVLHAFQSGNAAVLSEWAAGLRLPSNRVTFFNFLDSHEGIGLNPVRGILPDQAIEEMAAQVRKHGGLVSGRTDAGDSESAYALNIAYFDALSDPHSDEPIELKVRRFLAAQAIMLSMVGLPGIYVHSLFGSHSWQDGAARCGHARAFNRRKFDADVFMAGLQSPRSLQHRVYQGVVRLLKAKASTAAFHPHGAQLIMPTQKAVFSLLRVSDDAMQVAFCLHNVSPEPQTFEAAVDNRFIAGDWRDLLSDARMSLPGEKIQLEAYQVMWLVPAS